LIDENFILFYFFEFIQRTKEIGESSKTILQKKTNKSSTSRSSTTINNPKQQRKTINQDSHLSPNNNNPLLPSERPLRLFFFISKSKSFLFSSRERLVHLLAAKSYKKPELLVRLKHGEILFVFSGKKLFIEIRWWNT
jgi:hypothetical protein